MTTPRIYKVNWLLDCKNLNSIFGGQVLKVNQSYKFMFLTFLLGLGFQNCSQFDASSSNQMASNSPLEPNSFENEFRYDEGFVPGPINIEPTAEVAAPNPLPLEFTADKSIARSVVDCASEWMAIEQLKFTGKVWARGYSGISYKAKACYKNQVNVQVFSETPKAIIATYFIRLQNDKLIMKLFPRVNTQFAYSLRANAPLLKALDRTLTTFAPIKSTPLSTTRYYPYQWKGSTGEIDFDQSQAGAKVAKIDMAIPGFSYNSTYYAINTLGLTQMRFVQLRSSVEFEVYKQRTVSSSQGDSASRILSLSSGDTSSIELLIAPNIQKLQELKFGQSTPMSEKITHLAFKNWTSIGANLSESQFKVAAKTLSGHVDSVIIRTMAPEKWIADIFRDQGLRVYWYQYWGAVRQDRKGNAIDPNVKPEWVLKETTSKHDIETDDLYTAPVPKAGAWLLLDVRRPEVREFFINRIANVVASGWDGVFFDGPYSWVDSNGRMGGGNANEHYNDPNQEISLSEAKATLLGEIKTAIRSIDPESKMGVLLSGHYYDHLYQADFLTKEFVFGRWGPDHYNNNPDYRVSESSLEANLGWRYWAKYEPFYIGDKLAPGNKSSNPLLSASGTKWMGFPHKNLYVEFGDFFSDYSSSMAKILADIAEFRETWITDMAPKSSLVVNKTPSRFLVKEDTELFFNKKIPLYNFSDKKLVGYLDSHKFKAMKHYQVAERTGLNGWLYTREGFAWRSDKQYLTGSFKHDEHPKSKGLYSRFYGYVHGAKEITWHSPLPPRQILFKDKTIPFTQKGKTFVFILPQGRGELLIQ